jgi:hypothetical protein
MASDGDWLFLLAAMSLKRHSALGEVEPLPTPGGGGLQNVDVLLCDAFGLSDDGAPLFTPFCEDVEKGCTSTFCGGKTRSFAGSSKTLSSIAAVSSKTLFSVALEQLITAVKQNINNFRYFILFSPLKHV